ncbi:hypothetical protein BGW37DRAFT_511280 [Umbelopsis sp. PMI_123]|nr:hypothetical protein BGW37DRAFT_511280 [Umbelopsis sp. PMI_123]
MIPLTNFEIYYSPTLGNSNSADATSGNTANNTTFTNNSQPTADAQSLDSKKLQIRVLGVPETGAKSRVETQIKLCMQLVTDKGEKVPLWSHLKLPEHMVARDKLKRSALMAAASSEGNGKIAITSMDGSILSLNSSKLLHLDARVICASDPSKKVITCFGCIQRERRRSQRKKENKNKPDVEDPFDQSTLAFEESRVLLFNCSEIVDFSSGDTILPTRITCYCRHHDEKIGFRILFAMKDHTGKEIATGMSPPIMITDDHKSSKVKTGRKRARTEYEHPRYLQPQRTYQTHLACLIILLQPPSAPRLHRLIPNEGPTYGGIEVTVLGSGFHEGLTCMFGDSPAIPTHCWSPNTLVCILPPSANSGTVVVSFKEHPLVVDGQDVVLFTYFNESDRALMELALQVVGLKMTGKVEDAREIAMRIVQGGSAGGSSNLQASSNQQQQQQQQHSMQSALTSTTTDSSPDLTLRNHSSQSMLHLACMLGFTKLTQALLDLGCPVNAIDRNGYTALHYASWLGHSSVVKLLIDLSNANPNVANSAGLTPLDMAKKAGHYQITSYLQPFYVPTSLPVISSEEDGASSGAYAASSEMDSEFDYTTEDDTSSDDEVHNDLYIDEHGSVWLDGDSSDSESDDSESALDDDIRSVHTGNRAVNWLSSGAHKNRSSINEVVDAVAVEGSPLLQSDDDEPSIHQHAKQEPNWMKRTITHLQQQASNPLNHIKSSAEMLHNMPPMLPNFGLSPMTDSTDSSNKMVKSLTDHILAFPRPVMPNFAAISNMSMASMFGGAAIPNQGMMKAKTGEAEQTLAWYMALAYAMGAAKGKDESAFDKTDASNRATTSRSVRKQHHLSSAYEDIAAPDDVQNADENDSHYLQGLELMEEKKRRDRKLFVFWVPLLCLMVALLTFQFLSTQPTLAESLIGLTDMKRTYLRF